MAFKKVGGFEPTDKLDLTRDGENTETIFKLLDVRAVESKTFPGKMNNVYTVEYEGKKLSFWGNSVLDRKMAECNLNNTIKVIYLGEVPNKKKGLKPYKNYDVFEDDGTDGEDESSATPVAAKKTVPF